MAELALLPDAGTHGDFRMMQERNSRELADRMAGWIERRVPQRT